MSRIQSLPVGKNMRLLDESPVEAGSLKREFTIDAPDAFVTIYMTAASGDVLVKVYEFIGHIDEGKNKELQTFGTLDGSDINTLITRKAGAQTSQLYVEVTYTDACSYEIWVRGAAQDEASVRILGANAGRNSQITLADGVPTNVIPTALTDRAGIVIFNNSSTVTAYWGYTALEASVAAGYPLLPKMPLGIDMAAGAEIYMTADGGSVDLRISEASS